MEVEKNGRKFKEEDHNRHLSGAYIRRLVKQLSSSKTKVNQSSSKSSLSSCDAYYSNCSNTNSKQRLITTTTTKLEEIGGNDDDNERQAISQQQQQPQQQQQHKKQVRRRLHTSRPYQERLLNMAEARREIVTALKFHRAAQHKNQYNDDQQQQQQKQHQQQQQQPPPPLPPQRFSSSHLEQNLSYSTTTTNFPNLYSSSWSAPPTNFNDQNLVIASATQLPNQTLGLNLNFHDFNNIITTFPTPNYYLSSSSSSSNTSNPSSSSPISSSSSFSVATHYQDFPSLGLPIVSDEQGGGDGDGDGGLEVRHAHATLDDEEMANIRSIGEQHQMEWNDTLNLVTTAWWFKFFKKAEEDDHHDHPFHDHDDEAMEFPFPDWLSTANDSCILQQQHFNDHYSCDYFQDPALPCMEIGEIEEMDEEWLA